jgi:hypothetical protein
MAMWRPAGFDHALVLAFYRLHAAAITSVHISRTFSRIMLQWRSKAFTRASSFRLFLRKARQSVLGSMTVRSHQHCSGKVGRFQ